MDLYMQGYQFFLSHSYENAVKCFDSFLKKHQNDINALHGKGWSLVKLGRYNEAAQCFAKSEKDILSTFRVLVGNIDVEIEERKQLAPFLDIMLKDDIFFQTITANTQENIDIYKKIYIKSMFIISLLHVNSKYEKLVAHYTNEKLAEILFIKNSPIRLSLITTSNDSKEGQSLLDYFYNEKNLSDEQRNIIENEFGFRAFATSFTFNLDHLNQFRLYGKNSDRIEAGGMSFVVNQYFFNSKPNTSNTQESIVEQFRLSFDKSNKPYRNITFEDKSKLALFRCIYIDPNTGFVASIGQKEEYNFYQDEVVAVDEDEKIVFSDYQHEINRILKEVRIQFENLKKDIEDLDPKIVSQLLLSLRYLTKDVSFKEEQECRIMIVKPRDKANVCLSSQKKYFDYLEMKKYLEKIILGPRCFKESKEVKEDFEHKCMKIIDCVCPDKKDMFKDEIDKMFLFNKNAEIDFKKSMKSVGIENIENSRWVFDKKL